MPSLRNCWGERQTTAATPPYCTCNLLLLLLFPFSCPVQFAYSSCLVFLSPLSRWAEPATSFYSWSTRIVPQLHQSSLLICKTESQESQRKKSNPDEKPTTAPVPRSQVLGKVKDFLGVISEANKRLQLDAKDNSENYDIEVLNGNESQVIEMDLMLGIADLHTPDAVAAAESAIAGCQPVIPLPISGSSETESDDSSDEDDESDGNDHDEEDGSENGDAITVSSAKLKRSKSAKVRVLPLVIAWRIVAADDVPPAVGAQDPRTANLE
ncbi:hypothetical protein TorRG33x02_173360 [Trema orientale]|uniref:Uncharacterized protein n=1 Tax=Trema orientale TaxID=63057 RepID=A0A2P5EMN4_TREOI|nr:hypothetical protein TorRG33x02_173360 [Trema orientale]